MKLIFIVTDVTAAVHAGGGVERKACEVEIPDADLPPIVREFVKNQADCQRRGASLYAQLEIAQKV